MAFIYPQSELDNRDILLDLMGSTWSSIYEGRDQLADMMSARAELETQNNMLANEVLDSLSRNTVPVTSRRRLDCILLKQSQTNSDLTNMPKYGQGYVYGNQPNGDLIRYGESVDLPDYAFPLPASLVDAALIQSSFKDPDVIWVRGIDFYIDLDRRALVFVENPFDNESFEQREVYTGTEVTDYELPLWIVGEEISNNRIYERYGYAVGIYNEASLNYRDFLCAFYEGLVQGTARRHIEDAISAVCDIPLVKTDEETVELIKTDGAGLVIVTDANVYRFSADAEAIVAVGDVLAAGDRLTEGLRVDDFKHGIPEDLQSLSVGRSYLAEGYYGDLIFQDLTTELVAEDDVDGATKVSFALGGFVGDVDRFFDELHEKGVAAEQTLADLLDVRENPTTPATSINLPATINPLEFLVNNVLRNNAFLVRIKLEELGPNNLGLGHLRHLRRLVPPHTAMIVLVELTLPTETVILDGPPTDTEFGFTESVDVFTGADLLAEDVVLNDIVVEEVQLNYVSGSCI
jgi:hypothetical protein